MSRDPPKPGEYAPRIVLDAKGSEAPVRPTHAPIPRRPTLEPAPQTQGAAMDEDKPAVTPAPAPRRWSTEVGAAVRDLMVGPSDEATANWRTMRWERTIVVGAFIAYGVLHGMFGLGRHNPEVIYVERCEDFVTRKDQLKQDGGQR